MLVRHHMTLSPVTIAPIVRLNQAQEKMTAGRFRHLPVVQDDRVIGIVTDRDIRHHSGSEERTKVEAAMTENPLTISPDTTVEEAIQLMLRDQISGLPVVENGKLIGIITTSDILRTFLEITGASTPGSTRINVQLHQGQTLADAAKVIQEAAGEILAVGTYHEPASHARAFFLRVTGIESEQASSVLRQHGYTVL
ncbi:MAG: CBS domain-containing protein [Candidatus Binatia bacterium]